MTQKELIASDQRELTSSGLNGLSLVGSEKSQTNQTKSTLLHAWYDSKQLGNVLAADSLFERIRNTLYTGIMLYPDNVRDYMRRMPGQMLKIFSASCQEELTALLAEGLIPEQTDPALKLWVIVSEDQQTLTLARERGISTCLRMHITNAETLHTSIDAGRQHAYLLVNFLDPTNIPLELVIASLQASNTIIIKEINDPAAKDDAIVSLGVMEVGAEGVMFSPIDHAILDSFLAKLREVQTKELRLNVGKILKTTPVGMGYRSCIDLVTLFSPREGMLIGSTSQGGILCCPEVFYLPYMDLRPFRVNAGGIHSYVYNTDNRTNYLSELKAGSPAMVVGVDGKVRLASVGRIKTEIRPMRLIEVEFPGGEQVNTFMQDDWHVRIFSAEGLPLHVTELRPGDEVLGHIAHPGRHVGIKVDETILEF